jgi:flagellin
MSGTINSVNTNVGAMIALDALNSTNSQLNSIQKQISTGCPVADATDDGAATRSRSRCGPRSGR